MILIITGIFLTLTGYVLWYFLLKEDTKDKICIFIKKAKDAVQKAVKPIFEVFVYIKNFFGKIFKTVEK